MSQFDASRSAGLERLGDYVPRAGQHYATRRNFDLGAERGHTTSVLSPWLSHRQISEFEVCEAVLNVHSFRESEKYVQEVLWRTYWKGWLEQRPEVWDRYLEERGDAFDRLAQESGLCKAYDRAIEGNTGIEGFDHWASELVETGYLHNHARMWFSSIWIFTLGLPWTLGADFFLTHLIDGDAASNTLSWRWTAGLQTRGKFYAATASNIEKFTESRFSPQGLRQDIEPLEDAAFDEPIMPELPLSPVPSDTVALLVHEDDCSFEHWAKGAHVSALLTLSGKNRLSHGAAGDVVQRFRSEALEDVSERARGQFGLADDRCVNLDDPAEIVDALGDLNCTAVLTAYAPVGPVRSLLDGAKVKCHQAGIDFHEQARDWDRRAWPHATKGFFPFKKQIPSLLRDAGLRSK